MEDLEEKIKYSKLRFEAALNRLNKSKEDLDKLNYIQKTYAKEDRFLFCNDNFIEVDLTDKFNKISILNCYRPITYYLYYLDPVYGKDLRVCSTNIPILNYLNSGIEIYDYESYLDNLSNKKFFIKKIENFIIKEIEKSKESILDGSYNKEKIEGHLLFL